MEPRKYNLEERLIGFASLIIDLVERLPNSKSANHLGGQVVRSGTAPALIYGEAQAAESKEDFLHKTKVILKELRETQICNKIIQKRNYTDTAFMSSLLQENGELVAIFTASIKTAQQKTK